jgi:myo-inositol-1(or 4)-monophosphatase
MPSDELDTMVAAARAASAGLMRRFQDRGNLHISLKGPADFVSEADLDSEATIRATLLGAYPDYGFMAEESAPLAGASASRFVVDPLDGTTNFLHGIPHFAVSIALEREGRLVAGLVLDVPKGELFTAVSGQGAFCNGRPIEVCTDGDLSRSIVGTGIPRSSGAYSHDTYLPMLHATMGQAAGVRRFSAAAIDLAYVASGRFAAFFELGLKRWDVAAGTLLVREAGGRVTRPDGSDGVLETGDVLATNGRLHEQMTALLSAARPPAS